jgi:hypothetical protein
MRYGPPHRTVGRRFDPERRWLPVGTSLVASLRHVAPIRMIPYTWASLGPRSKERPMIRSPIVVPSGTLRGGPIHAPRRRRVQTATEADDAV